MVVWRGLTISGEDIHAEGPHTPDGPRGAYLFRAGYGADRYYRWQMT